MVTVKSPDSKKLEAVPLWLLNILLAGLVIYCSLLLAQFTWSLLEEEQPIFLGASSWSPPSTSGGVSQIRDSSILLNISLFGKEDKTLPQQRLMKSVEAPKTKLQLQLKGVFTSEREGGSSAIVAERGKQGLYYKIGEKLPGNAELAAVYSDRVLLERNGRLETLGFEDGFNKNSTISKVKPVRGKQRITSPEEFVNAAEKKLTENPSTALASVGLKPVKEGEASGYVYDGKNPMLAGMNLKSGDVVRSVNGYPVGDINKDKALLKQLYDQGSLEVEVERDGTSFYVNYPLH